MEVIFIAYKINNNTTAFKFSHKEAVVYNRCCGALFIMEKFEKTELHKIIEPFVNLRFKIYRFSKEVFGEDKLDLEVKVNNRTIELHFKECILIVDDYPTIKFKDGDKQFHFSDFDKYKKLSDMILNYKSDDN